jgi:hypothetical protein
MGGYNTKTTLCVGNGATKLSESLMNLANKIMSPELDTDDPKRWLLSGSLPWAYGKGRADGHGLPRVFLGLAMP